MPPSGRSVVAPRIGRSLPLPPGVTGSAEFSDDRRYRWLLTRTWANKPPMIVIATNPSSAGDDRDDSTIRILENLAIRQNKGSLVMLNAYGLVSTDFAAVAADYAAAVGEMNDAMIRTVLDATNFIRPGAIILAAWGVIERERHHWLTALVSSTPLPVYCLGRTKAFAYPRHPLRTQTRELFGYA